MNNRIKIKNEVRKFLAKEYKYDTTEEEIEEYLRKDFQNYDAWFEGLKQDDAGNWYRHDGEPIDEAEHIIASIEYTDDFYWWLVKKLIRGSEQESTP